MTGAVERGLDDMFARRPLRDLVVIDAHAHMGRFSRFFIPEPGPEAMVGVMDRCGVRAACLSSHLAIELDARRGNDETAGAVSRIPGRLAGWAVANPHQDPARELERWRGDARMAGVKLHPDLHDYPVTGPRYEPAWRFAEEEGLPVLIHTWSTSPLDDVAMLGRVLDRHPSLRLLAGHAGATRPGFDAAIAVARAHPGLHLELCGSHMTGEWVRRMVDELGPERVVFGSDFPFIDLRVSLGRVLFAGLQDHELACVLAGNAARLLGLPLPAEVRTGGHDR